MGRRAIVSAESASKAGSTSEVGGRALAPVPTPSPKITGSKGIKSPWQELEGGALEVLHAETAPGAHTRASLR